MTFSDLVKVRRPRSRNFVRHEKLREEKNCSRRPIQLAQLGFFDSGGSISQIPTPHVRSRMGYSSRSQNKNSRCTASLHLVPHVPPIFLGFRSYPISFHLACSARPTVSPYWKIEQRVLNGRCIMTSLTMLLHDSNLWNRYGLI